MAMMGLFDMLIAQMAADVIGKLQTRLDEFEESNHRFPTSSEFERILNEIEPRNPFM